MHTSSLQDQIEPREWQLRVDLAACYRLVALYGMSDLIFTHITAHLPGDQHSFLINPYGWLFDEITASSLVKIDRDGHPLEDSPLEVNPAGFTIHSCIHQARPEVGCVLHVHSRAGCAVSAQQGGLLPLSQFSTFVLPKLAYHDYEGVALRADEQPRLQADLGDNDFLILRNHGLLTVGRTVAEAFLRIYLFNRACSIQIDAQSGGGPLVSIEPRIYADIDQVQKTVTHQHGSSLAWPALLRRLDRIDPSYKN